MSRGNLIFGLIILTIGAVILLNGLNLTSYGVRDILAFWPVLVIAWGLGFILDRTGYMGKIMGVFVVLLGLAILGGNIGWFTIGFSLIWRLFVAILLILFGIRVLVGAKSGGTNFAIMGGTERKNTWNLSSESYLAFMGGIELDLRQAIIPDGKVNLSITAIMGGVEIIVPPDLAVVCDGASILGGFEFLGRSNGGILGSLRTEQGDLQGKRVVRINSLAIMGGVNVKAAKVGEKVD